MSDNVMMQISLVHIIFNVVSTIIMFPFAGAIVKLSCILVPDKKGKEDDGMHLQFIDERMLNTPPLAVVQVGKEVLRMAALARRNFDIASSDLINKEIKHFRRSKSHRKDYQLSKSQYNAHAGQDKLS